MSFLIVKAYTNSEWDSVSFAIVELTNEHISFIKEMAIIAKELHKKESSFSNISFNMDMPDWFMDDENLPEEIILTEDKPVIVNTAIDSDNFSTPEQNIRYGKLRIYDHGFMYVGYGKHTNEEFWTDVIPFELIN